MEASAMQATAERHPVVFVGAGPGDPELITCKGRRLLDAADLVVYAGSLVNAALLDGTSCVGAGWSKLCLHEKCKDVEIALCKISSRKLYGRHVCGISAACKECMGCLACLGSFLLAVYQLGQLES